MTTETKRALTIYEIDDIVNQIPLPPHLSTEIREKATVEARNSYYLQLQDVEIYPSMIPKLKDYVINQATKGFHQAGTHVGMNSSESTGQTSTQLNLDAFHQAGQSNSKSGFQRFQQKISLKKDPSASSTYIHFMDYNLSFEEAYMKAKRFVSVKIANLLEKPIDDTMFSILTTDSANRDFYPDFEMANRDYLDENVSEYNGFFARLVFNKEKLLLHDITLQEIATVLREARIVNGKDPRITSELVSFFCGPMTSGIIDVYPNVVEIENTFKTFGGSDENRTEFRDETVRRFFQEMFKNLLNNVPIGRYQYVTDIAIKPYKVHELIQGVKADPIEVDSKGNEKIRIWLDPVVEKSTGIPIAKLITLLELLGFTVDSSKLVLDTKVFYLAYLLVDKYIGETDMSAVLKDKESLTKYIDTKIQESEAVMVKQFEDGTDPTLPDLITDDIYRNGLYCIAITKGTNLREIRAHPEVDHYRTFSDSPLEIYEVIGIEACRNYLEKEIYDLFKNAGHIIAPRNITAMIDWMTVGPRPNSINSKSVTKQNRGIFAEACFEDPIKAVSKGAVFGPIEKINNTSTCILFGTRVNTGTGAFEMEADPVIVDQYRSFTSGNDVGAARLTSNTLSQLVNMTTGDGRASPASRTQLTRPARAASPRPTPPPVIVEALPGRGEVDDLFGFGDDQSEDSFNPDDVAESIGEGDQVEFGDV